MRNHLLGRSPAGRGRYLKRLNGAGPENQLTENVASDTNVPAFTAPITLTIVRSPSLTTNNNLAPLTSSTALPSSAILSVSQSPAIPTDAPLSSPSPTSSAAADAHETDTAATTQATASNSLNSSRPLPGGTIAAIVLGVSLALVALGFFVARKCSIRKRMRKRAGWNPRYIGSPVSSADYMVRDANNSDGNPMNPEKPRRVPVPSITPSMFSSSTDRAPAESIPPVPALPAPPVAYNNNEHQTAPLSAASSANPFLPTGRPSRYAAVQYTFIPSLPDELAISVGEMLRIVAEYDDGWALCMNGMGEEGMVPLECLEYTGQRNSQRMSSLSAT